MSERALEQALEDIYEQGRNLQQDILDNPDNAQFVAMVLTRMYVSTSAALMLLGTAADNSTDARLVEFSDSLFKAVETEEGDIETAIAAVVLGTQVPGLEDMWQAFDATDKDNNG